MAKSFSFSWSKLTSFETCPKRHYEVDIVKTYHDDGEAMKWGSRVHDAFKTALSTGERLPPDLSPYQHWVDETLTGPGELLVEKKFALTRDFQPTEYFGPLVWYRGIADALRISGPVARVRDWKTGKIKHDSSQLMLMAACIFANYPEVMRILTEFVWLREDCVTPETFNRSDMANEWLHLLPRVKDLEEAARTMTYPPKPGKLCYQYCPVVSCPFHGKRN